MNFEFDNNYCWAIAIDVPNSPQVVIRYYDCQEQWLEDKNLFLLLGLDIECGKK